MPWPTGAALRLRGAAVFAGDWHVLPGDGTAMLNPAAHRFGSFAPRKRAPGDPRVELLCPARTAAVDGPAVLLGGYGNFYHALTDYLVNWCFAEGAAEGRQVIVSPDPHGFERDIMDFMGVPADHILPATADALLRCDDLLVLPRAVHGVGHVVDRRPIDWLRARAQAARPARPAGAAGRRLYISRAGSTRRGLVNEDELMARLVPLGFELVALERLRFAEQAALFADAAIVIGPHGAGFANMLALPAGAAAVEIMPADAASARYFVRIAKRIGIRFEQVLGSALVHHRKGHAAGVRLRSSFTVDIDAAVAAAERAIAAGS